MRNIVRFTAVVAFLLAGVRVADAGNMFVLGDLLSGNPESSADGAHNPFLLYETDFVTTSASTAAGFYDSNGLGVQDGDSMVGVLGFSGLASSITDPAGGALGAGGFGALIFAGDVSGAAGDDFNLVTSAGGVEAALGNPASGVSSNFLSLVVSETLDFSTSTLSDIGTALNSGVALEVAAFDIASSQIDSLAFEASYLGPTTGSPSVEYTSIESRASLALDLASNVAGIEFWTINRDFGGSDPAFDVEANASYPFGSFGNELYLNLTGLRFGTNISATANTGSHNFTTGVAIAAMNPVPEPSMFAIMGCMGVAGVVARRRKQRKTA